MMQFLIRSFRILSRNDIFFNVCFYNNPRRWLNTKLYQELLLKGLFCSHFPSNANINELLKEKQTIYAGFDATNKSLHVGNLLVLISLLHLFQSGHRIIVLIGDATARIGDPSGKLTERPILADDLVDSNSSGIENDVRQVFENYKRYFASKHSAKLCDKEFLICRNSSWYQKMNVIEFVNKFARQLRMADMLSKNSIKERLDSPSGLSFAEFSYQTFQAYDWYHLFKKYGCQFQVGGTDQMVNIHNGYDLIKKLELKYSYGLFIPLITDDRGNKIGKSGGKAIFLNANSTTPFGFYQYFMTLPDSNINKFLKLFSFRPMVEVEKMIQNQMQNPKPWHLQKKLAEEMTMLVHGQDGLQNAQRITNALFNKNLEALGNLNQHEIQDVFDGIPIYHMEFNPGLTSVLDLALKSEFFNSELNAIKTIKEGGFYVNYNRESDPGKVIEDNGQYVLKNSITIVSLGKRNHRLIKWL